MAKKSGFGNGVLFRNKKKLDQLNFNRSANPAAYENAPDLTGNLRFTTAVANALMQYLKAAFEAGREDAYGKVIIGFAANIKSSAKAGDYISAWCSEPYDPKPEQEPAPVANKTPDLDDAIPF